MKLKKIYYMRFQLLQKIFNKAKNIAKLNYSDLMEEKGLTDNRLLIL